jgi:hypothetical protein
LLLLGLSRAFAVPQKTPYLLDYIKNLNWDAKVKGPLLSIEPGRVAQNPFELPEGQSPRLDRFSRKLVKVGRVSVMAPTSRYVPVEFDNPWDLVPEEIKICGLLANLSDNEFDRLNQIGLSESDLSGTARAAFELLLPSKIDVGEQIVGVSASSGSGQAAITLDEKARTKLKLQICQGLEVSLGRENVHGSIQLGPSFNSLDLPKPNGERVLYSEALTRSPGLVNKETRTIKTAEKSYRFNWGDPRLAQSLDLKEDETIGSVIDRLRKLSGIEIDARDGIEGETLHSIGTNAMCADVLHAIVIAVDGVIRPVGPAFIIAEDLEGKAAREARLLGLQFLAKRQLEPLITGWVDGVITKETVARFGYLRNDPLKNNLSDEQIEKFTVSEGGVQPISALPQNLQNMAGQMLDRRSTVDILLNLKPDLASLEKHIFARWILPDGRAFPATTLKDLPGQWEDKDAMKPFPLPLRWGSLAKGSAVEIYPGNAALATAMLKSLGAHGIEEVWLDSTDRSVIAASIATGSKIDLVIRPWRQLKNEPLAQPDLNILAQTGTDVANLPEGRMSPSGKPYPRFSNTLAPDDPALTNHWKRLIGMIPKIGLNRIIVLDPLIGGYCNEDESFAWPSSESGRFSFGSLLDQDPAVNDFGYGLGGRLRFLREHHIDPVDLLHRTSNGWSYGASGQIIGVDSAGKLVFRPTTQKEEPWDLWKNERRHLAESELAPLNTQLGSTGYEVCLQLPIQEENDYWGNPPIRVGISTDGQIAQVNLRPVGPAYSEDAEGNIVDHRGNLAYSPDLNPGPICFDFQVPAKDFDRYLNHFFTLAPAAKKKQ